MRIISGSFRGKRINAPANLPVRPTTDFAKEALFNVLHNQLEFSEISVLDLFSGIGSISLEFLSRGCKQVTAVDQEEGCIKFLSEISQKLNFESSITLSRSDVFSFLKRNKIGEFDLIFADPPFQFDQEKYQELIRLVFDNRWLTDSGKLVVEHSPKISLEQESNFSDFRKYGNIGFSFFEHK